MESARKFKAHPQSAPGDFYVVNEECISCGAPHVVAPDLIGWAAGGKHEHCLWKKQPETRQELEQAFAAFEASCIACYRYAGNDPSIMARIGADYCDQAPPPFRVRQATAGGFHFTLTASQPSRFVSVARAAIRAVFSVFR